MTVSALRGEKNATMSFTQSDTDSSLSVDYEGYRRSIGRSLQGTGEQCSILERWEHPLNELKDVPPVFGYMFTVATQVEIEVLTFTVDARLDLLKDGGTMDIEVYTKPGGFTLTGQPSLYLSDPGLWTQVAKAEAVAAPAGNGIMIPPSAFTPVRLPEATRHSFYITMKGPYLDFTVNAFSNLDEVFVRNDDLTLYVGGGLSDYYFPPALNRTVDPQFAGAIHYEKIGKCDELTTTTSVEYRFIFSKNSPIDLGAIISAELEAYFASTPELKSYQEQYRIQQRGQPEPLTYPFQGTCPTAWPACMKVLLATSIKFQHLDRLPSEELLFVLYKISSDITAVIQEAIGDENFVAYVHFGAVATPFDITLSGVPNKLMDQVQLDFFEDTTERFLDDILPETVGNYVDFRITDQQLAGGNGRRLRILQSDGSIKISGEVRAARSIFLKDSDFPAQLKATFVNKEGDYVEALKQGQFLPGAISQDLRYTFFQGIGGVDAEFEPIPDVTATQPPATQPPAAQPEDNSSIIGIAVGVSGGILLLAAAAFAYFCYFKRRRPAYKLDEKDFEDDIRREEESRRSESRRSESRRSEDRQDYYSQLMAGPEAPRPLPPNGGPKDDMELLGSGRDPKRSVKRHTSFDGGFPPSQVPPSRESLKAFMDTQVRPNASKMFGARSVGDFGPEAFGGRRTERRMSFDGADATNKERPLRKAKRNKSFAGSLSGFMDQHARDPRSSNSGAMTVEHAQTTPSRGSSRSNSFDGSDHGRSGGSLGGFMERPLDSGGQRMSSSMSVGPDLVGSRRSPQRSKSMESYHEGQDRNPRSRSSSFDSAEGPRNLSSFLQDHTSSGPTGPRDVQTVGGYGGERTLRGGRRPSRDGMNGSDHRRGDRSLSSGSERGSRSLSGFMAQNETNSRLRGSATTVSGAPMGLRRSDERSVNRRAFDRPTDEEMDRLGLPRPPSLRKIQRRHTSDDLDDMRSAVNQKSEGKWSRKSISKNESKNNSNPSGSTSVPTTPVSNESLRKLWRGLSNRSMGSDSARSAQSLPNPPQLDTDSGISPGRPRRWMTFGKNAGDENNANAPPTPIERSESGDSKKGLSSFFGRQPTNGSKVSSGAKSVDGGLMAFRRTPERSTSDGSTRSSSIRTERTERTSGSSERTSGSSESSAGEKRTRRGSKRGVGRAKSLDGMQEMALTSNPKRGVAHGISSSSSRASGEVRGLQTQGGGVRGLQTQGGGGVRGLQTQQGGPRDRRAPERTKSLDREEFHQPRPPRRKESVHRRNSRSKRDDSEEPPLDDPTLCA